MNTMIGRGEALTSSITFLSRCSELATHAGSGLQQSQVEGSQLTITQRRRNVAGRDTQRQTLDHRGLPTPASPTRIGLF